MLAWSGNSSKLKVNEQNSPMGRIVLRCVALAARFLRRYAGS